MDAHLAFRCSQQILFPEFSKDPIDVNLAEPESITDDRLVEGVLELRLGS